MGPAFYILLALCGAGVGFLSGLLGIGGGIVMFPLLLYLPPALGFAAIPVKDITGLTMVQGFFASLSAVMFYKSQSLVNKSLVLTLGSAMFLSSLSGALLSKYLPDKPILFIFGLLALTASLMMFIPRSHLKDDQQEHEVKFSRPLAVIAGIFVGFPVGLVGQGGAFIIIPLLLYVLKIPLRVALGSTLGIGLFSATAGMLGKTAVGQIPFLMSLALLAGAIPMARIGGLVGKKTDTRALRWVLAFIITVTAVKIWSGIF
jgi:hypothetical protein